jgi:hypothetical protein
MPEHLPNTPDEECTQQHKGKDTDDAPFIAPHSNPNRINLVTVSTGE